MKEMFPVRSLPGLCNELLVESVEVCSCEKWEAGSWGRGQVQRPPLEAATKQQQMNAGKILYVL
jgi:hypothetical protein